MEFNLLEYIPSELIVLIPILFIIGAALKKSRFRDNVIPWVLMLISIILSIAVTKDIIQGIISGILISGVPSLGSQLYIQSVRKKGE